MTVDASDPAPNRRAARGPRVVAPRGLVCARSLLLSDDGSSDGLCVLLRHRRHRRGPRSTGGAPARLLRPCHSGFAQRCAEYTGYDDSRSSGRSGGDHRGTTSRSAARGHSRRQAEARAWSTAGRASSVHRSLRLLDLSSPPFVAGNVGVSFTPTTAKQRVAAPWAWLGAPNESEDPCSKSNLFPSSFSPR